MKVGKNLRVGVALGGGAARGIAHLGVLKVLEEEGIPVHALAGVSIGSVVAAGYAAGLPLEQLCEIATQASWSKVGGWSFSVKGFSSNERMEKFLAEYFPVRTFEELKIPLRIVATDLYQGKAIVLDQGDLLTAIRASCAIPALYVPVELNGYLLADGYLTCNLPVSQVREMGADVVIASAIGLEVSKELKLNNVYQILMRSFCIMSSMAQHSTSQEADVVIRPQVEGYSWSDLDAVSELIQAGEEAARGKSRELKQALNPSLWSRWGHKRLSMFRSLPIFRGKL